MSPLTALTYVLPHRALSSLARALAYSTNPSLKQWLIDTVTRKFGVDLSEAAEPDPRAYPTFNAFFTRALKPGARVADPDPRALLMPADGHVSQCGDIVDGRIFQAKGQAYTTAELLGSEADAAPFADGVFATVYLSPRDYHRVHMPWAGTLRETVHVPGRLFSVGTDAVASVPRVFARNERLAFHFDTEFGPMVQVMVGALLVSLPAFQWARRHPRPLLDTQFFLPERFRVDADLMLGATLFGIGWGIAGLCPGPALTGLASGIPEVLMFVTAMAIGMGLRSWRVRQRACSGEFECKS